MYDTKKVSDYKKLVSWEAKKQWKRGVLEKALYVHIIIYRQINKSESKKRSKLMDEGLIRPIVKPDTSNYVKLIEDALNGIAYKDDSQIVDLYAQKFYSKKPRVEVRIEEL